MHSVEAMDAYTDMFSLWDSNIQEINLFIEQANGCHSTIEFKAGISVNETTLDHFYSRVKLTMKVRLTFLIQQKK